MRIGIDLGGHTLIAALVSEPGPGAPPEIIRLQSEETPPGRGVRDVLGAMAGEIALLSDGADISSVGVAAPGMLDKDRRLALRLSNFPHEWDGLDIPKELGAMLAERQIRAGVIKMENDANCYALGEGLAGEAVGVLDFVAFTLGTGIGCGIVSGGRLLTGAHGMAGEGGHMVVSGDAPCGCG